MNKINNNLNDKASIKKIFRENTGLIQKIIIAGIMMIIFVVLSFASDNFLTVANLLNVARQTAMVMIAGSAVTLLMISGNFDLTYSAVISIMSSISMEIAFRTPSKKKWAELHGTIIKSAPAFSNLNASLIM